MGRPVSEARKNRFLKTLAKTGRITESADIANVSCEAIRVWRKEDEEFAERFAEAEMRYCDKIEKEVERRAIDGWDEPVFQNGVEVGKKKRFSDMLLLALTKSRLKKYRDKVEVDAKITGQVLAVPLVAVDEGAFSELSKEKPCDDE